MNKFTPTSKLNVQTSAGIPVPTTENRGERLFNQNVRERIEALERNLSGEAILRIVNNGLATGQVGNSGVPLVPGFDFIPSDGPFQVPSELEDTNEIPEGQTPPSIQNFSLETDVRQVSLTSIGEIVATWDPVEVEFGTIYYQIEYWIDSEKKTIDTTTNTTYTIFPAEVGQTYSVRIRPLDYFNTPGEWTNTETILVADDGDAPANVFGATAAGGLDKVVIRWTNPTDTDFIETQVYRGTSSGFTPNSSNLIVSTRGTSYVDSAVTNGVTYFYKFTTRDVTGNQSAASGATTSSPAPFSITSGNIANYFETAAISNAYIQNLDAAKITTGTLDANRIAAGSIDAFKLDVSQLSAISANLGTITAGLITGAIIRTAASGARIQLDSTNGISGFNAASNATFRIQTNGEGYLGIVSPGNGILRWNNNGEVSINGILTIVDGGINMTNGYIRANKTSFASTLAGYWIGYTSTVPTFNIGNATNALTWNGSALSIVGGAIQGGKTSYFDNTAGYWLGLDAGTAKFRIGTTTSSLQWTGSALEVVGGAIFSNKTSYASTTAGYWIGLDSGTPKLHVGNASNYIRWTGTGLEIYGDFRTSTGTGARVEMTSANDELVYYDSGNAPIATIGTTTWGGAIAGTATITGGDAFNSTTANGHIGVLGMSRNDDGVRGYSVNDDGVTGETSADDSNLLIAGTQGSSVNGFGLRGDGKYGAILAQSVNTTGGSLIVYGTRTSAPAYTALAGTIVAANISGTMKLYIQTAGGAGGTGSTWQLIGLQS